MNKRLEMPIDELRRLVRLEPETGFLYWLPRPLESFTIGQTQRAHYEQWQRRAGTRAFLHMSRGYYRGRVGGTMYLAHRIVWALHTGTWPEHGIDHINGIKTDNRPENLRDVSQSVNMRNAKASTRNRSGTRGVSWDRVRKQWSATIHYDGRQHRIGLFDSLAAARAARFKAEREHGYSTRLRTNDILAGERT